MRGRWGYVLGAAAASVTAHAFGQPRPAPAAAPTSQVQPVPYSPSQPVAPPATSGAVPEAPLPPPPSGPPGDDTLHLRTGGVMQGTLLEILPNDHVTLKLASGQTAIIEWERIERIERKVPAPAQPPQPARPVTPPPPREPVAFVHVESPEEARLETRDEERGWATVCAAPCDMNVPVAHHYRVVGPHIIRSEPFTLLAIAGQRETIRVTPSSRGVHAGGVALIALGSTATAIGLLVVLIDVAVGGGIGPGVTGGVIGAVGIAGIVGGSLMVASNPGTTESQELVGRDLPPAGPVARLRPTIGFSF